MPMKVRIDHDACEGHQLCAVFAPQVFGADEEGYAVLVSGGLEGEVPSEYESATLEAAESCPEQAITVEI